MVDISICVDTGNSGTKATYLKPDGKEPKSLFMSSALVDKIEPERLKNQLKDSSWIGFSQPVQQAWIKVDDSLAVVGELAKKFSPPDRRKTSKYQNAFYKILAIIGVIVQSEFEQKRGKLKIRLGLLLPWNEYKDHERLLKELQSILPEYEFRGSKIRVLIENKDFFCYPEGGGIAMSRVKSKGLNWFKNERFGVLMTGDRNWTALNFESGHVQQGKSPLKGFSFLLDDIIESAPGVLDREILSQAIFRAINESNEQQNRPSKYIWSESEAIQSLSTASRESFRKNEIYDIDRAISSVARNWFEELERFVLKMFPQKLTEINVCGGALPFFYPFIENHFNCVVSDSASECKPIDMTKPYTPTVVNGGITKTVAKVLNFDSITSIESALPTRFADVFCLMEFMKVEEKKLVKQI